MHILRISIFLFLITQYFLNAQELTFEQDSAAFIYLSDSISLNGTETWDDPNFEIPIGFDFEYFDKSINKLYISDLGTGGVLTTSDGGDTLDVIFAFGVDLLDRGTAIDSSLSPISFKTIGSQGEQICKIEWRNAGFYGELLTNPEMPQFLNFQLWLYEGSNIIEIRFGHHNITDTETAYSGALGPTIGFMNGYDLTSENIDFPAYFLNGNAESPDFEIVETLEVLSQVGLEGIIREGTIFRFIPGSTSLTKFVKEQNFQIHPNPASDRIYIKFPASIDSQKNILISSLSGIPIKHIPNLKKSIDISSLTPGAYLVTFYTGNENLTKIFFKQ